MPHNPIHRFTTILSQALQMLGQAHTLFSQHRSATLLPAQVAVTVTTLALLITGCTGLGSPSLPPVETKPALTESSPVPPTEQPTISPTLTALSAPETTAAYPQTFPERTITKADFARQQDDFSRLLAANTEIAEDASVMRSRIQEIADQMGIPVTISGILDGYRWGYVLTDGETGDFFIIQNNTSGEFLTDSDISPYLTLMDPSFDAAQHQLLRVTRPGGIPDTAYPVVFANLGWLFFGYAEDGNILAVYNPQKNSFTAKDGTELFAEKTYTFLKPEDTWETGCAGQTITSPLIDEAQYLADLARFHTYDPKLNPDQTIEDTDISLLYKTYEPIQNYYIPGWQQLRFYGQNLTEQSYQTICGTIGELQFIRYTFAFHLQNGEYVSVTMPLATSPSAGLELYRRIYFNDEHAVQVALQDAIPQYIINSPELRKEVIEGPYVAFLPTPTDGSRLVLPDDPSYAPSKELMDMTNYLADRGVIQSIIRLATEIGTQEDVAILTQYGFFPAIIIGEE